MTGTEMGRRTFLEIAAGTGLWLAASPLRVAAAGPEAVTPAGFQPSAFKRVLSISLRGVPSGLPVSKAIGPAKPTVSATSAATSRMRMSEPEPTLRWLSIGWVCAA